MAFCNVQNAGIPHLSCECGSENRASTCSALLGSTKGEALATEQIPQPCTKAGAGGKIILHQVGVSNISSTTAMQQHCVSRKASFYYKQHNELNGAGLE